jgi:hypothetical protein
MYRARIVLGLSAAFMLSVSLGCDDDDGDGSEAARLGVGEGCANTGDCPPLQPEGEGDAGVLECLPFKGGYCGLTDCAGDDDCPAGSACVTHDGANYCFLVCADKPDCNARRGDDDEANCSGSAEFVTAKNGRKACIPPSGN